MTVSLSMRAAWQQVADRHESGPEPEPEIIAVCCRRYGEECCNQPVPEQQQPYPPQCVCCGEWWPCPDRVTALAQINALNEARWITAYDQGSPPIKGRHIPDPEAE